jgi:hypothetical protein
MSKPARPRIYQENGTNHLKISDETATSQVYSSKQTFVFH